MGVSRTLMKTQYLNPKTSIQEFLGSFVRGKTVLDLGCVEHDESSEAAEFWLHKHLLKNAKSVLGMDILEKDVEQLRQRGYNIICGDATKDWAGQTFDVVVAGEIIEHVPDPGGLLTNMRRHLNPDGQLVITTPHPFFFANFLVSMLSKENSYWHPDHVAWFCPYTLRSALHKAGYKVEAAYYATRSRKLRKLLSFLRLPCYGILAMSIIVIARSDSE